MKKFWGIAILLTSVVGLSALVLWPRPAVSTNQIHVVRKAPFEVLIDSRGEVEPIHQTEVIALGYGQLTKLVPNGRIVHKGEVLAELDTHDLQQELQDAQLNLGSDQADLASQGQQDSADRIQDEANVTAAAKTLKLKLAEYAAVERTADPRKLLDLQLALGLAAETQKAAISALKLRQSLVSSGVLTKSEIYDAQIAMLEAKKNFQIAKANLEVFKAGATTPVRKSKYLEVVIAKNDLNSAQYQLANLQNTERLKAAKLKAHLAYEAARVAMFGRRIGLSTLIAPQDGTLIYEKIWLNGGQGRSLLKEGDQVWSGEAVMRVADFSAIRIKSEVPERDYSFLRLGMPVRVKIDTISNKSFRGHLTAISPMADWSELQPWQEGSPKVFGITVGVDEKVSAGLLKPGTTGNVQVVQFQSPGVLTVPLSAVSRQDGRTVVKLLDSRYLPVDLGEQNGHDVVINAGLKDGDRIVLPEASS